jgi:hypothetical protein
MADREIASAAESVQGARKIFHFVGSLPIKRPESREMS